VDEFLQVFKASLASLPVTTDGLGGHDFATDLA